MSVGPRNTGLVPVLLVSNNKWWYVMGVTSNSPSENVGSIVKTQNSLLEVLNVTISDNHLQVQLLNLELL